MKRASSSRSDVNRRFARFTAAELRVLQRLLNRETSDWTPVETYWLMQLELSLDEELTYRDATATQNKV